MLIELHLNDPQNVRMPVRQYDPEFDDIRSILVDVCQFIGKEGLFRISGFGETNWPVTLDSDLPVFLEQLPGVLRDVFGAKLTEIDFYEQGIERTVILNPVENFYELSCTSQTHWQPSPKVERISQVDLKQMLAKALETFINLVRMIAPDLEQHPWLQDWLCV
jgi:hypothetical protein